MTHLISRKGNIAATLALAMALSLFSGCGQPDQAPSDPSSVVSATGGTASTEASSAESSPTEPPATTPADGDPNDVTCLGSYTAEDADAAAAANTVVAVITVSRTEMVEKTEAAEDSEATEETTAPPETQVAGETDGTEPIEYVEVTTTEEYRLTNSQLQVYYWMEVAAYRNAGHEIAPDFSRDLATQVCLIDDSVGSWQQYFLREALNRWAAAQSLTLWGDQEGIPLEEAYIIREDLHEKHLVNIPATDLLYGYNGTAYRPNSLHQAYLDDLEAMVSELAAGNSFSSIEALAQDLAGAGASGEDLLAYAELSNRGYMFLTELGYYLEEPTAEEVEAYFSEHEAEYAAEGITRDSGKYVTMRHILRLPEGAEVAEDGTVTADEVEWTRLNWNVQTLLMSIQSSYPYTEGIFATYASNHSADTSSVLDGGLYENLVQGQLIDELDAWLFDDARVPGDIGTIRTALGIHLVYFSGSTEIWYAAAEEDLLTQKYQAIMDAAQEKYPARIDYSAIRLGTAQQTCTTVTADTLLYADIAHERYPEAPLYLQQDYQKTRYGAYSIVSHGCGITTMAMLASYMCDEAYTPPVMCDMFGRYCSEHGTDRTLFVYESGDLGFYLKEQVFSATKAYEALEQGYIVVCLQHEGYWTRGGHYLLLEELTDEGNVVVRDSNIYNYNKLEGHYIDEFEWKYIPGAAETYFIFHPKSTSRAQCIRCTDGTSETAPDALLSGEYQCSTCDNALLRRNAYLNY